MKTYESEYKELVDWMKVKTKEYMEQLKNHIVKGHDSELSYERAQDVQEYNRRLTELKIKYGKDKTVKESDLSAKSERIHI